MDPMKYRKAVWTKVEPEDKSAAAIQVERMEQHHARKAKINAFMDDLKQLSDKHGIRLSHNFGDGDVCLFDGSECLSDNVDLDIFIAHAYEPPIPVQRERLMYPRGQLSEMSEALKRYYMGPLVEALKDQSSINKLFEKGNK